jgi:hypothetical protein
MRVVHVRVRRAGFANGLGEMRQWLDHHNRPLVRFETELGACPSNDFECGRLVLPDIDLAHAAASLLRL